MEAAEILSFLRLAGLPVIGGVIGYVTNFVAVRMIFRPRRPVRVFGMTFQGLVPRRQDELAASIGRTVREHLFSHEDVQELLTRPETQARIEAMLHRKLT